MVSFESDNFDADLLNGKSTSTPITPAPAEPEPRPAEPRRQTKAAARPEPSPQPKAAPEPARAPKKEKKQKTDSKPWASSFRVGALIGVLFILVAAYLLITMVSSLTNGVADESVVANKSLAEVTASDSHIANTCGPFGAFVAHLLFTRWIGMGIFVLIYYLGALGVSLIGFHRFNFWKLTFNCITSAVCVSIIVGLAAYLTDSLTYWGGYFGYYVNDFLTTLGGYWAAIGVSIFLVAVLCVIFYDFLAKVIRTIGRWIKRYRAVMAARHQAAIEAQLRAEKLREAERAAAEAQAAADAAEREAEAAERKAKAAERIAAATSELNTTAGPDPVAPDEPSAPASPSFISDDIPGQNLNPAPTFAEITSDPLPPRAAAQSAGDESAASSVLSSIETPSAPTSPGAEVSAPFHEPTNETVAEFDGPVTDFEAELTEMPDPEAAETDKEPIADPLADLAALAGPIIPPEIPGHESDDNYPEERSHSIGTPYDPHEDLSRFRMPELDLLRVYEHKENRVDIAEQEENKERITRALQSYGIEIAHIEATVGATITLYEIVPAPGVRIAKIKKLGDDMAMSLQALGIRIIAPIPGKGTIGMEVPNREPQIIGIREILSSDTYVNSTAHLPMAMGTTITNEVYVADLAKTPHLLVAGATGMGKSVGLNCIIASLLYKMHPSELKFVLIDPKQVEFSLYSCIRNHYLAMLPDEEDPIITEPSRVVGTLNSLVQEMENRYLLLKKAQKRNIVEYNAKFIERSLSPAEGHRFMPYIVVIIDEFGDLMLTVGKEIETPVSRIAAKARAVGIHMILATQRPSVDVITGVIKANFPARMAFAVSQPEDSRTILGRTGAEQLIGRGDMLISIGGKLNRVQCAFIDTDEVESICQSISDQIGYPTPYELPPVVPEGSDAAGNMGGISDRDPLFEDAARAIIESGTGSTSYLQRKFTIGYPRAGKIMDQLEMAGVVGPAQGGKPRKVLMDFFALESMLGQ